MLRIVDDSWISNWTQNTFELIFQIILINLNWPIIYISADYPQCSAKEFPCSDHRCIPHTKVCDLKQDCSDGQDEEDCGEY